MRNKKKYFLTILPSPFSSDPRASTKKFNLLLKKVRRHWSRAYFTFLSIAIEKKKRNIGDHVVIRSNNFCVFSYRSGYFHLFRGFFLFFLLELRGIEIDIVVSVIGYYN